jgi:hypothetical protein
MPGVAVTALAGGLLIGNHSRTGRAARGGHGGGFVHGGGDGFEEGDPAVGELAANLVDIERVGAINIGR